MDVPENLKTPSNSRKRSSSSPLGSSFDDGVNSASTPYAGEESPAVKCLKNLKTRRIEMDRRLPAIAEEADDQESARTSDVDLPTEGEEKIDLPEPEVVDEGDATMPRVRVSGCHSLNSTAVYLDPKRRQMDEEEESNMTKLDDYSILFEKKEPGTFIVLHVDEDETTLAPVPELPDDPPAVALQKEQVEEKEKAGGDSAGRNLHVYKSNDEQENIDNDNSKWKPLKGLKTDEERYRAIQTRWPNSRNPHPAVNLSSFNWRQKNGLNPPDLTKNRSTRPRIMKYNENDGVNPQSPIVLFKNAIKEAELHFNKSKEIESNKLVQDLEQLCYIQRSQLHYNYQYSIGLLKYKHQKEVDDLVQQNRQKIYHLRVAFEQRIKNLKNAITETEKMYKYFYVIQAEVSNQTGLLEKELNHWFDVEDMINLYSYFYN